MSHVHEGPLATYNSLTDTHLAGYFANNRMRRHLRKAGLVSKRGEIVSESTYRLNMSRREHKKHVKDMLAQAIVHKSLDMERSRQAEIKKKLEEIAKIQLVRRVRASTSRKGDEDILPILTPRSSSQSPRASPRGRGSRRSAKPHSNGVPGVRRRESGQSRLSVEEEGDVLYLDDEGRPITPALGSDRRNPEQSNIDSRHLHSLDTVALRKYALLMAQMEEGRGLNSPYMMPQVPMPPRPPSSSRSPRSARRVQSASPRRVITTDSRLARLHRPETAKSHAGDQQTLCRVAMKYHGWALQLARERTDLTQEVVIEQQHCGGNTLTVFKERLEPGSKFEFISYRHRGYPFSLSLYVDGQMDSRVSTCCEYRHSRGAKIGGKQGHFSLLRVSGAVPCYKCQVTKGVRVPSRASPKRLKRPAEVRREEVIVVATKQDPGDRDRHRRQETSEPAEDDYADDFEDSQASHSSKYSSPSYSSESESESDTEPRTPKEEEKKKEKTPERHPEPVFQPKEDRGEEREEKEEEEELEGRAPSPRGRDYRDDHQERDVSSARSPRVPLNGTGRAIDDYSSDDDEDERVEVTPVTSYEKTAIVSVEDVDANNTPIRSRRRSASSSSSSSSSADDKTPKSQGQRDAAVINVDLLDREEKREQEAAKERERREELRRKEENDILQKQQAERAQRTEERKKAEEARRQEDLFRQQQRDEERRRREEQRRREAEEEKQRREEEEERRRHQSQIEDDPDARERHRMEAQMLRDEQIRREQQEREEKRKQQEEEREKAWQLEETKRGHKLKMDAEERERKRVEEGLSSARSETSTARSTTASSAVSSTSAATSSAESSPRHVPAQTLTTQDVEVTRPVSPVPAAAVYEDRRRLREPQNNTASARPTSPLPPAAMYEDRRQQREREQQAPRVRPVSPRGRPVSPLPPAAVYEDRKAARRAEEEERAQSLAVEPAVTRATSDAPAPAIQLQTAEENEDQPHTGRSSTTEVSTTATSDDDSDDDDIYSQASLESVDVGHQYSKTSPGRIQQQDSGTADSSSDSDASSEDASAKAANIGASTTTDTANVKEEKDLASGPHATSESDGENMHGGADPDNVAQQEEGGELQPLKTRELPAAKAHKGEITDLLPEGADSVDLSNVLLNKTQVYQLGSHLESSSTVKMVTLCNTGLDDNDLQRLSEALAASPSQPVMLNLSLNSVTQKGIKHVLHALKAKPSIKLLILQGNPIGDAGIKDLTQGLQDLHRQARANRKAVAMDMTSDTMSVDSSSSSIDPAAMAQKYLLQELDLTDTQMTDSGAAHMAQLVASNVYVENVNLSHNPRITAGEGWKQMGEAFARNRCIRTLTLDGNKIGDEGIEHLARGLQNNRVLRSLALEDAGIGPEGGEHLMNMLKRNTSLLELTLSPGNTIPDALAEDIGKYIALNRTPYNNFGF